MDKSHGISSTPSTILFDDPIPKWHPQISPHIQKMRKGCGNDYIEACGAVYGGGGSCLK